jgi:hypothetical protein
VAARLRLGLPPSDDLPPNCSCGKSLADDPAHFLDCPRVNNFLTEVRHNPIARVLAQFAKSHNLYSILEPTLGQGKRPDLDIVTPGETLSTDVSVTNPTAQSHISKSCSTNLGAAKARERVKVTKYKLLCAQESNTFIPFVLESYGAFGSHCSELITQMLNSGLEISPTPFNPIHARRVLAQTLSVALQVGNAKGLLYGCSRVRQAHVV